MDENDTGLDKAIEGCWFAFAMVALVFWAGVFVWAYQSVKGLAQRELDQEA